MTNAEARFNNSLRPRKPEGSLGRTAQDVHLDSHTAPELCVCVCMYVCIYIYKMYIYHALINALSAHMIHINLNMIFYTHVKHSPTKTIYIKYYLK